MAQAIRSPRLRGRPGADGQHLTRSDLLPHPRHFRGRHHAATIFVVLVLAVFGFRLFPEKDVTVLSNGQSYRVSATFDPRHEALEAANISLEPGDRVLYGTGGNHASLAVQRARPVAVEVDGSVIEVRTLATTVSGALAEAGVELRPGDRILLDGQLTSLRGPLTAIPKSKAVSAVPALAPVTAADAQARLVVQRAKPVAVYIDTLRVDTASAAGDVADLLQELGMTVLDGDLVRPALDTPVTSGLTVRLAKARTVNVRLDGKDTSLYTQAATVADILRLLQVDLGPEDSVVPDPETPVTNGMAVSIATTRTIQEDDEQSISPPTLYETDPNLASGTIKVVQGTPGARLVHYRVTYKNGQETQRIEVGRETTREATPTRHITGTKAASASRPTLNTPDYSGTYKKVIPGVRTTYYTAAEGAWARDDPNYGRTATGAIVDKGVCAVDPNFIPLYTKFYVPGYGTCVALDTGGAIKGNIVDLGFPEGANPGWPNSVVDIYIID